MRVAVGGRWGARSERNIRGFCRLGRSSGGVEVILTSPPTHGFEVNHFRSLGIEPTERKILTCKSELQHRAAFEGIASKIIDMDTPGLATQIPSRLPYQKIRRPVFPLNDI